MLVDTGTCVILPVISTVVHNCPRINKPTVPQNFLRCSICRTLVRHSHATLHDAGWAHRSPIFTTSGDDDRTCEDLRKNLRRTDEKAMKNL